MKTIQKLSKVLLLVLLTITFSCSSDDNPLNDDQNPPQGQPHSYSLTFTGGEMDGDAFSNTISNSIPIAMRSMIPNNGGGNNDIITISMTNLDETNDFSIGMNLYMNGNQAGDYGTDIDNGESILTIVYNDNTFISESGSVIISNFDQFTYHNVIFPYFKLDYTAQMMGINSTTGTNFSTQVSGTITIKRPVFN